VQHKGEFEGFSIVTVGPGYIKIEQEEEKCSRREKLKAFQ